jgi:cation diffusion facilitator CzcD-associated flavoprotein CzcO
MSETADSMVERRTDGASMPLPTPDRDVDSVVIGAGMAGLYAIKKLRSEGQSVLAFEGADDVGGVWLHNGYPGARVDIEAYYYSFYDPEIYPAWTWTDRYPSQPELLAYLRNYADYFDLRPAISFSTRVTAMGWDADTQRWIVTTDAGQVVAARHVVLATGQLSEARALPFPGVSDFAGQWLETSHWPREKVELAGKRVAVIGTGSSGVQAITEVAKVAASLHVFQRTPNYVVPSQNAPIDQAKYRELASDLPALWDDVMRTPAAYLAPTIATPAKEISEEQRLHRLEEIWEFGGLSMTFAFPDQRSDAEVNAVVSDFVRARIRQSIDDPALADILEPRDYPLGTRRLCVCNGYYETYNRDNVNLVNLRQEPIVAVIEDGIKTAAQEYEFDVIISALGFDAFTGAIDGIDIRNEHGEKPSESWDRGPSCYLGLMLNGFPNLYFLTGPGSPSVLVNFNAHNVFHIDYVADLMGHMQDNELASVQPSAVAQEAYRELSQQGTDNLLRKHVDNYMTHVNDDGSRFFIPFSAGWSTYVDIANDVKANGYSTLEFEPVRAPESSIAS